MKTLEEIVAVNPYLDYLLWWPVGPEFIRFMRHAILAAWRAVPGNSNDFSAVQAELDRYLQLVYDRNPGTALLTDFITGNDDRRFQSGEFDALSFAFFRSAFSRLDPQERRDFTRQVGLVFFAQLADFLFLEIPPALRTAADLDAMAKALAQIGHFLVGQGYLRDHFSFDFAVITTHDKTTIAQDRDSFLVNLLHKPPAYAVYEMGYPAILPSAVYLFHTMGEAQHHSSRTIENLFDRAGCTASETEDFDPTGFPADKVVELWEIRLKQP